MLEHVDEVADPDRERAAAPPFASDGGDQRHAQPRHLAQVERDRLRLAALLGADAGIGARRVDEGQDRP